MVIDIYIREGAQCKYKCSTIQARSCKQAKQQYLDRWNFDGAMRVDPSKVLCLYAKGYKNRNRAQ